MGWKSIKKYYDINHIVQIRDGNIWIGSPYISNIIVISSDGVIKKRHTEGNENLSVVQAKMDADPVKLRELINTSDNFSKAIIVYTYKGGDILEKYCEALDWPNVTHDGCLMYENTYSQDKQEVIKWARKEAGLGIKLTRRLIREREKELQDLHELLEEEKANLKKLMATK